MCNATHHKLDLVGERLSQISFSKKSANQLKLRHVAQRWLLWEEGSSDDNAVVGSFQDHPDAVVEVHWHPVQSAVEASCLKWAPR